MATIFNVRISIQRVFIASIILSGLGTFFLSRTSFMSSHFQKPCADFLGLCKNNASQNIVDNNIEGDVYHSEEVFNLNYAEMEKKFKIYVYPDENDYTNYHTISGKYASEGYFFKNIKESVFLTDNPNQAHLFFIPISCHKMHQKVSSYKQMASIVGEYVESLIQKYPYWNRTLGADHFFLTCHDIDVRATEQVEFLVKNSIRVVCSPTYDSGFIPHKDVSLPLVMQPFTKPAGGDDMHKRQILGYWAGVCSLDTRDTLVELWGNDTELDIHNTKSYNAARMKKFYISKFCICPAGSRLTSNRITMAIHYGCVPVILADYYDLPFNDVLDWRKFSVILIEHDVYRLKDVLKAKSGAEYRMLHNNLLKVQRHFQWNTPPVKYDAFHMVVYELWLRRNVVKY